VSAMSSGDRQRLKYAIVVSSLFCRFKANFSGARALMRPTNSRRTTPIIKRKQLSQTIRSYFLCEAEGLGCFLSHVNWCIIIIDLPFNGGFWFGHGMVSFPTNLFNTKHMIIRRRTLTTITQQQHNILISRFNKIYRITVE